MPAEEGWLYNNAMGDTMATVEELERRLSALETEVRVFLTGTRIGITVDELNAKARTQSCKEWTDDEWADLMAISGVGDGPEDLSIHMRRYLYGEDD